jgi:hypothetical protein
LENTIWGLKDHTCRNLSSFEGLARLGSQHFKYLYSADRRVSLDAIIQMELLYPHFVEEEDNLDLMKGVKEAELKEVLYKFQKDKILELYGWSMDFFVGLYDLLGKDILKVI